MVTTMDPVGEARPRAFEPGMETGIGASPKTPGWDLATERRIDDGETLADAMGWFSIGLGVTELVAAEQLCRWLGMRGREDLVRLYGVREIGTGIGILTNRRPTAWIWGRIAGDVLDLATLSAQLGPRNRRRHARVWTAVAAVVGATALDVLCVQQLGAERRQP